MKFKKENLFHIIIIAIILIVLLVAAIKLFIWNRGTELEANPETIGENFDVESEDYVAYLGLNTPEGLGADGKLTVAFLGDDSLGNSKDSKSVPSLIAKSTDADVLNLSFANTQAASTIKGYDGKNPLDAFSLFWLANSIAVEDYTRLHEALGDLKAANAPDTANYEETIKTLESTSFQDVDLMIITHGLYDYLNGNIVTNPEDMNDFTTYSGSLSATIENLAKAYPHMKIILMSPTFCAITDEKTGEVTGSDMLDTGYGTLATYMIAAKNIAVMSGVSYLDNIYGIPISSANYKEYLEENNFPNQKTREIVADRITQLIIKEDASATTS